MTKLTAAELARQTLTAVQDEPIRRIIELLTEEARDIDDLLRQLNSAPDYTRRSVGQLLTTANARRLAANGVKS